MLNKMEEMKINVTKFMESDEVESPYTKKSLRRTASYSNIQIKEATAEQEEEDDVVPAFLNELSAQKQQQLKLKKQRINEKLFKSNGNGIANGNSQAKSYFENGSIRNTARDEDFFHCLGSYLDEAINKMKLNGSQKSED